MANQYKNKVIYNGQTLIDLTGVTVTPQVLSQGYTAIDASGAPITGTASGGGTTTPYYMWKDSDGYIHITATEHSGYQINVSGVEEHSSWVTIYEATISDWTQNENGTYDYVASVSLGIVNGDTYRVTYDGTPYVIVCPFDANRLGSDVYGWDGVSPLEYPFGIEDGGGEAWIDVTTGGTHTIVIEHQE